MCLDHQLGVAAPRIGTLQHGAVTWLVLERPTPDEIAHVGERLGLSRLTLDDLVGRGEPPRVERHEHYDLGILRFPVMLARPRRLAAAELRLAIGPDWVVTAHDGDLRPLVGLYDELQLDAARRDELMAGPAALAQAIVRTVLTQTSGWSERLGTSIEALEDVVLAEPTGDAPRQLLGLRREVDELERSLRRLPELLDQFATGEHAALWRDAADLARRQVAHLDEAAATLGALDRALDHHLASRRNGLLRTIAVVLATTLPALLVAALYGSNLRGLPGADSAWAFEIALAIALVASLGTVGVLRRARWL